MGLNIKQPKHRKTPNCISSNSKVQILTVGRLFQQSHYLASDGKLRLKYRLNNGSIINKLSSDGP